MPKLPPAPLEKAPEPPVESNMPEENEEVVTDLDSAKEVEESHGNSNEEINENQATVDVDHESDIEHKTDEHEEKAVEASQNPIQQIDFIPSWATAFTRLFSPFSPKPVEPDLELGRTKDVEAADFSFADEHSGNQTESHVYQPLEHLKSSLSKILPMSAGSTAPATDFSRRSWWMPQVPVALPSWFPGQHAAESSHEAYLEAADPPGTKDAVHTMDGETEKDHGSVNGDEARGRAQIVKRRPRSGNKAKLPLTLRVAYRELRKELWGDSGRDADDETKAALQQKRKKWVKRFREKAPVWAGQWDNKEESSGHRLSGRLVQLVAMPCFCTGGFVLYLALAYGFYPLAP